MPTSQLGFVKKANWAIKRHWFSLLAFAVLIVGLRLNSEHVPATLLSGLTVILSYFALEFSRDRFRLELFDKRWEIYEKALEFCSVVTREGTLRRSAENQEQVIKAIKAAEASFRGIGWHKTQALFGDDIYKLFDELNKNYSRLRSHTDPPRDERGTLEWASKEHDALESIWNTTLALPAAFRPYIYFGDIRANHVR